MSTKEFYINTKNSVDNFCVDSDDEAEEIINYLTECSNDQTCNFILIYKGIVIEPHITWRQYGLFESNDIYLKESPLHDPSYEKDINLTCALPAFDPATQKIELFADIAPVSRIVRMGTNVEIICDNKECTIFDKLAWVPMLFSRCDLKGKFPCPICSVESKPVNIGFIACKWQIIADGNLLHYGLINNDLTTFQRSKDFAAHYKDMYATATILPEPKEELTIYKKGF